MNQTSNLLEAIESLWSELPALVGEDWPRFEAQLTSYLEQLETEPERESIIRALILDLFFHHEQAHLRLVDVMAELAGEQPPAMRGVIERGMPSVLTRLLHATVTRYTDIACPRRVWIETPRVSVIVRLTVQPPVHTTVAEDLAVREGLPVRVRVEAPAFDLLNEQEQETTILAETDSPPLVFDLCPQRVGHTRINFDFFQGGNPMGTTSVPVEITADEVGAEPELHPGRVLRTEFNAPLPDLMLYVAYEPSQEQPALVFTLRRAGEVGRTFHPVPLRVDPRTHARHLYEGLTELTGQADPTIQAVLGQMRILPPEDVDRRVKQFGQNLWRDLIPEGLRSVYETEREAWKDKTLLIVSDEPHIPWELLWPYAPGDWEDEAPWCVSMRLTRWLRRDAQGNGHEAPPTLLRLSSIACLVPTDSGLAAAQAELDFLNGLMEKHSLSNVSPTLPEWSKVLALLEQVGYDWLHAAAHGNFYPDSPDADSAIWLQEKRPLTPNAVVGAAIEGYISKRRPGFVFNACHTGRQGWELTRLGGWANRLISSGAGLFIAPLWTVTDRRAVDFAKTFYAELMNGRTVAEAARQGRLAARRVGDPTWLAYSVYAHPNARVVLGAEEKA